MNIDLLETQVQRKIVQELIKRLFHASGLRVKVLDADLSQTEHCFTASIGETEVLLPIEVEGHKVDLVWCLTDSSFGPDGQGKELTIHLLKALAGQIYAELLRTPQVREPAKTRNWEDVLRQAWEEHWDQSTFAKEVAAHGLKGLPRGLPVRVICRAWTPDIPVILQSLFPEVPINLALQPDLFLYIQLDKGQDGPLQYQDRGAELIREIYSLLADELGISATILVGDPTDGDVWEGFAELGKLAEIHRGFFAGSPGLAAWQVGLASLMQHVPAYVGKGFVTRVLGSLNMELLDTVEVFLAKDMNVADAARALFVHRNTLLYRLDRIADLTGYNPRDFNNAISFYLALWLKKHF